MEEQIEVIGKIVKEYNQRMTAIDKFNRGWIQKSRKQHFQEGKATKTNYFIHPDRWQCELNVLESVLQ